MRPYVVTYEGVELHLTAEEYVTLHHAAYKEPVEAERLAIEFLRRETTTPPAEEADR